MTAAWHRLHVPAGSTTEVIPVANPYRHSRRRPRPNIRPWPAVRSLLAVVVALVAVLEVVLAVRDAAAHVGELAAVPPLLFAAWHVWRA